MCQWWFPIILWILTFVSHVKKDDFTGKFTFIYLSSPNQICLPCKFALSWLISILTMRFTELPLLVACIATWTHPLLFVNGLQVFQPTIKNNPLRRDALIWGLLVPVRVILPIWVLVWVYRQYELLSHRLALLHSLLLSPYFKFKSNRRARIS